MKQLLVIAALLAVAACHYPQKVEAPNGQVRYSRANSVVVDPETGCQYLADYAPYSHTGSSISALTPRNGPDRKQMGCGDTTSTAKLVGSGR